MFSLCKTFLSSQFHWELPSLLRPLIMFSFNDGTQDAKSSLFCKWKHTFLKARTWMWVSHTIGRCYTNFSLLWHSLNVRAGSDPEMPWAKILPCTELASSDKFQRKIMFVASQCFVEQNIFCWAILYLLLPLHCPALQSSGSAEGNMGRQWIPSSFPAAALACRYLHGLTELHPSKCLCCCKKNPQDVNFLVEFPAKKWRKDPWRMYPKCT